MTDKDISEDSAECVAAAVEGADEEEFQARKKARALRFGLPLEAASGSDDQSDLAEATAPERRSAIEEMVKAKALSRSSAAKRRHTAEEDNQGSESATEEADFARRVEKRVERFGEVQKTASEPKAVFKPSRHAVRIQPPSSLSSSSAAKPHHSDQRCAGAVASRAPPPSRSAEDSGSRSSPRASRSDKTSSSKQWVVKHAVAILPGNWQCDFKVRRKWQHHTVTETKRGDDSHMICETWEKSTEANSHWQRKGTRDTGIYFSLERGEVMWGKNGQIWLDLDRLSKNEVYWMSSRGPGWRWERISCSK